MPNDLIVNSLASKNLTELKKVSSNEPCQAKHNLRNNFTQTGNNEVENEQNDKFTKLISLRLTQKH